MDMPFADALVDFATDIRLLEVALDKSIWEVCSGLAMERGLTGRAVHHDLEGL